MKVVERLFLFRYAVRSRNWMLHLKSTEDLIGDVISLDRIKYRRMLPVYLAEMKGLQDESPDIWNYFLQGGFTVKKGDIPFTSLGADHAGKQQNKLLKIDGGLIGITKNKIFLGSTYNGTTFKPAEQYGTHYITFVPHSS